MAAMLVTGLLIEAIGLPRGRQNGAGHVVRLAGPHDRTPATYRTRRRGRKEYCPSSSTMACHLNLSDRALAIVARMRLISANASFFSDGVISEASIPLRTIVTI